MNTKTNINTNTIAVNNTVLKVDLKSGRRSSPLNVGGKLFQSIITSCPHQFLFHWMMGNKQCNNDCLILLSTLNETSSALQSSLQCINRMQCYSICLHSLDNKCLQPEQVASVYNQLASKQTTPDVFV